MFEPIKCPHCGSEQWTCYDDSTEIFEDVDTGEDYEAPVGYMKCGGCGKGFAHHDESPNKWLGKYADVYGWEDGW